MDNSWIIDGNFAVRDLPALLLALSPELNLNIIAITITHGRSTLKDSAKRVQSLLHSIGRSIPIYLGAENPLVQKKINVSEDQSDLNEDIISQLEDESKESFIKEDHAALILAKLGKAHSGLINLLCVGPLTNIVLAYHIEHDLYKMFNKVVVSGGSIYQRGSLSKSGDFNFTSDAHAANLTIKIFKSKCTIIPSEVNFKYAFESDDISINENSAIQHTWKKIQRIIKKKSNSIGAILYIKDPNLVEDSISTKCQVETRSKECLGQLLILWPINSFFSEEFPDEFKKMETAHIIKEMNIKEGKKLINISFSSINL